MEARIKGTNDPFTEIIGFVLDSGVKEGNRLILKPEEIEFKLMWIDEAYKACMEIYNKFYSGGEFCHIESFNWGFQEGIKFIEKKLQK